MIPTRQIIVGIDIAFVDLVSSYPVDTSALPSDVVFVGQQGDAEYRWLERQPFDGRELLIDDETSDAIDAIFADADAQHAARLDAEKAAREAAAEQTADDTTTDTTTGTA